MLLNVCWGWRCQQSFSYTRLVYVGVSGGSGPSGAGPRVLKKCERGRALRETNQSDGKKMGIQLHCGQEGEDNRMELGKTHLESVCPL